MHMPITPRESVRLTAGRRIAVYGVGAGLWLTGVLWLVYHYFLQRQGAFGPGPHPLEFWWRASHGLFGFAALWTLGLLWGAHVVRAWRTRLHRVSGGLLLAVLGVLAVTGYLLYYVGDDSALSAIAIVHWGIGLALPLAFAAHRISRRGSGGSARPSLP